MTDTRHEQLQEIFLHARGLAGAARTRFLDDACRDAPDLRPDVEKLLAHDAAPHAFVDQAASGRGAAYLAREIASSVPGSGRAIEDEAAPPLPERIGRYDIVRVIDRGGMGIVYEAEQREPHRRVALKVIRPGLMARGVLKRFRREAEVLGRLRHPGIAQIYEAGTADGQPFFAMEFVEGLPLTAHAERARLDTRDRLELVARICDALQHAHQNGVIHRDLKPSNILVTDDGGIGRPRILDFGVARATDADIQTVTIQTTAGELVGTVPYMSPEQAAGDPSALDTRTDIYSIGVLAFELLAGRGPYDLAGKMIHEAVRVIREHEPSRLSSFDKACRGDVETIIAKALEKEKDRRYPSAGEMAADIRRYLGHQPIVARPATSLYQLRKFVRRNRALAGMITALIAVLVAATVVSSREAVRASNQRVRADRAASELRRRLYASELFRVDRMIENSDAVRTIREALDAMPEDLRGWEWDRLSWRIADRSISTLETKSAHGGLMHHSAAASPERDRVATVGRDGSVKVWDLAAGKVLLTLSGLDGKDAAVDWSADGRLIAARGLEGPVRIWDAQTGGLVATVHAGVAPNDNLAVNADGSLIVTGTVDDARLWDTKTDAGLHPLPEFRQAPTFSGDGRRLGYITGFGVSVVDVESGATLGHFEEHTLNATGVAFDRDARWIASGSWDKTVMAWDIASGRKVLTLRGHGDHIDAIDFSRDRTLVATGGADQTVRVWDVSTGARRAIFCGHRATIMRVWFTPDARRLVSFDLSGTCKVWQIGTTPDVVTLAGHPGGNVLAIDFSPDGRRLLSGGSDDAVRVWDTASGALLMTLGGFDATVNRARFRPSTGDVIAACGEDGAIRVWDAATGRLRWSAWHNGEPTSASGMAFSPDGSRLATSSWFDNTVRVWSVETGQELLVVRDCPVSANRVEFMGDDTIGVACDGTLVTFDAVTGVRRWSAEPVVSINPIACDPGRHRIAVGSSDGTVHVLDTTTGETLMTGRGHGAWISAVKFSADGSRLFVAGRNGTVKVWSLTGEDLLTLGGNSEFFADVAVSPDDRTVATSGPDGTILLWRTGP